MPIEAGLPDLGLRPAIGGSDDADVAAVYLASRSAAPMPAPIHAEGAIRSWISARLQTDPVWVAEVGGEIVGYARFTDTWLDDLYVLPGHQGVGVGAALLDVVKAQRPDGFCLWVFEVNEPARRFYRQHGLIELECTDGSANEEEAPDLRMAWTGVEPLVFLRRLIDEVDAGIGDLLARRAALTHAVQGIKHDTSRDPVREAEIAAELARRAPALGADRTARIIDAIITESLAAADEP